LEVALDNYLQNNPGKVAGDFMVEVVFPVMFSDLNQAAVYADYMPQSGAFIFTPESALKMSEDLDAIRGMVPASVFNA
jgi:hypothetical protein